MISKVESALYFDSICLFLTTRTYPDCLNKKHHDAIRKASKNFKIIGQDLFYQDKLKRLRRALRTKLQQDSAIKEAHGEKGAHCGYDKTLAELQDNYYWMTMVADVRNWIKSCDACQRSGPLKTGGHKLHPIVAAGPWQILGVDLVGPLETTLIGNKHIITVTDLFTKFVYAEPLDSKSAENVYHALRRAFCLYGPPLQLITDQVFAFGRGYSVLFAARILHGFSSPCIAIAVGYPFGGLSLYFLGKSATFVTIAVLVLCQIIFQCVALQDSKKSEVSLTGTSLSQLVKDPYIFICAGIILVPEMTMALIESTVPIWLIENFHPHNWELGTVFVPDSIGFWIACNLFGFVAVSIGRWRCNMVSLLCIGTCLFCIPLVSNISHLIIPHFGIGLSLGIIDASLLPMMALLVDNRHVVEYGNVYAITQVAISLGFALGPILGSLLVPSAIVRDSGAKWLHIQPSQ